jgi:predicted RNase H-related nuclease YkuK (DUF458 family)
MFSALELEEIRDFIKNSSKDSSIYIGTDSKKQKNKKTRYASVVCIHYDSNNGSKVFGNISFEKDIKEKLNKPFMRMMNETYKTAELYLALADCFGPRKVEVHLDIAKDEKYGSNCALSSAMGYIKGVCNIVPISKPAENSFAASIVADKFVRS